MGSIAAILAACALLSTIELRRLTRLGYKKERWVFSLFMLIGAGLAIAQTLHAPLPSPIMAIHAVFEPITRWLDAALAVK